MVRATVSIVCLLMFLASGTDVVLAQGPVPTYSVEAVALNDVPLPGAPVKLLTASPGEIITAEIYLRDWSPQGEDLRAYQVQLDENSFQGLISGHIKPTEYDLARKENRENPRNAFIDLNRPDFIHAGSQTIAITDTRQAPGYRWLSVLIDFDRAPVSPQDGSKFYCGTVRLTVSVDASGVFNIGPSADPAVSGLLVQDGVELPSINYESLEVTIGSGALRRNILASDPPTGAIDARVTTGAAAAVGQWEKIQLTFDSDAASISKSEFAISALRGTPPTIKSVSATDQSLTLNLDRPVNGGTWTSITHRPTGNTLRFGVLPGDVDGNGIRDSRDLLVLLDLLQSGAGRPSYSTDLNGDGTSDVKDALTIIDCLVANLSGRISG